MLAEEVEGVVSVRHKWLVGFGVVLVLILVVAVAIVFWPAPAEEKPTVEPKNSEIFRVLAAAGLNEAIVDVSAENVIVDLRVPETANVDGVAVYVLGVIARAITDERSVDLIIQQGGKKHHYQGSTTLLHQVQRQERTVEELLKEFTKE